MTNSIKMDKNIKFYKRKLLKEMREKYKNNLILLLNNRDLKEFKFWLNKLENNSTKNNIKKDWLNELYNIINNEINIIFLLDYKMNESDEIEDLCLKLFINDREYLLINKRF